LKNTKSAAIVKLRNTPAPEIAAIKNKFLPAKEKRQSRGGLKL